MTRKESLWLLLNGERREVADGISLSQLIETLELPVERIAVELNQSVVRRGDWTEIALQENDRLEVVHFVGGGAPRFHYTESGCKVRST